MIDKLNFKKYPDGLIPAIVQDDQSRKVLMLGYMDRQAVERTLSTRKVCFYSRSKQRLWTKGEESGNFLTLISMKEDCDQDALLVKVQPSGPVCHLGTDTCWAEENKDNLHFLSHLTQVIEERKHQPDENSYVSGLLQKPVKKVAQKVGEEAVETILESETGTKEDYLNENADLLFHQMVLLARNGYQLEDVIRILQKRHAEK